MAATRIPTASQWAAIAARLVTGLDAGRRQLAELERLVVLARERPSEPDGFPTGAAGFAHDRSAATTYRDGGELLDDEAGVSLTSVEAAVVARAGRRSDPFDADVLRAVAAVERAGDALASLTLALAEIARHRVPEAPVSDENGARCTLMARIGVTEPVHARTTLDGLLPTPTPVGRWVYDFARTIGRLPTADEMRAHADGRRVVIRTGRVSA